MLRDDSATSSVLAVVLMVGFVSLAAVSLFVVGTVTLEETRDSTQERQVENSFRQLNKEVSSVAFGRQKYRTMNFDIKEDRAAFRKHDTGRIQVYVDGTKEVDRSVGSLVYESEGSTTAFQAGGIWQGTGRDSQMLSKPPVSYQDGSLSFPIPVLTGDDNVRRGNLDINKQRTISPLNDDGYIEGRLVKVEITSEYYMGWAEYFRTETNDVAVSVDHSPSGPKGTVTVKLGESVAKGSFDHAVAAMGGADGDVVAENGNAGIDGPVAATDQIIDNTKGKGKKSGGFSGPLEENAEMDLSELDDVIERKVAQASTNASIIDVDLESGGTLSGGNAYYADDGFTLSNGGESVDVDLGSGNVTLVVDGDISLDGGDIDVNPQGTDNSFRIYTTGELGMRNSRAGASWSQGASHLQVYGTSTMLFAAQGGSTTFVGAIYAPRDEPALTGSETNTAAIVQNGKCDGWDVCIGTGSSDLKGAIVGGPTHFSQSAGLTYDSSLTGIESTLELEDGVLPPPVTFIKVSVHEVAVNNSGSRNLASATGFQAWAGVSSGWFDDGSTSATTAPPPSSSLQVSTADRRSPVLA